MKSVRERLNGSTGFVITSGMILILIAVVTFGFAIMGRVEARIVEVSDNCVEKKTAPLKSDMETLKNDNKWFKDTLIEIKQDIKELKHK